jgi:hypothetical protein
VRKSNGKKNLTDLFVLKKKGRGMRDYHSSTIQPNLDRLGVPRGRVESPCEKDSLPSLPKLAKVEISFEEAAGDAFHSATAFTRPESLLALKDSL